VQTEPAAMAAPTSDSPSLTAVQVSWLALAGDSTGGSPVDSYRLQYLDLGTVGA
jgi:hypothetical protein